MRPERGRARTVICLKQVEDTRSALAFLATRLEVDPDRIGVMGASFGAAVAVYTAGVDARVAACVSTGGRGDGEKKFRKQHESPEAWARFIAMLEDTLVFRSSDNGPHMESWPDAAYTPFRCAKGSTWEGGVRVPGLPVV